MSLINDALKQVGRTKPPAAAGAESSLTLRPVEAAKHGATGTRIVLVVLAALLAIACSFLFRGVSGVRKRISNADSLLASAREAVPQPPETTNSDSTLHTETGSTAPPGSPGTRSTPPNPAVLAPPSGPAPKASVPSPQPVAIVPAEAPPPPPPFPSLKLQGIFYKPGEGAAMINSRMIRVGDRVQRARVVAIERETVSLEWYGETNVLTLR